MKALIADDDDGARIILENMLSALFECDLVTNGEEAVKAFVIATTDGAPYDLICLDIMMPLMTGQEALDEIRTKEEDLGIEPTLVIMISALDTPGDITESFCRGGDDYLIKPIVKEELLEKLYQNSLLQTSPF